MALVSINTERRYDFKPITLFHIRPSINFDLDNTILTSYFFFDIVFSFIRYFIHYFYFYEQGTIREHSGSGWVVD